MPIASNVALFPPGFHAGFWSSASGTLLAYRTEASDKPRLTRIFADGKRQSETGLDDFYTHVRVSSESPRSGRPEVIVTPFPASGEPVDANAPQWQVSTQGGSRPRWSGDGRWLYYVSLDDLSIMAGRSPFLRFGIRKRLGPRLC